MAPPKNRPFKDKMMSRAVPGYGLTQSHNPWANPPKYSKVEDALQNVIDGLKVPKNREKTRGYIYAGIPISTLAEAISLTGFSENLYNPDVAELMKPALNLYLTSIAVEDGFKGDFRLTPQPDNQEDLDDIRLQGELMQLMKEQNPRLAKNIIRAQDEDRQANLKQRRERLQRASKPEAEGFVSKKESN